MNRHEEFLIFWKISPQHQIPWLPHPQDLRTLLGKLVPQKSCQQASLLTAISMEMSHLILTAGMKHRLFPNLPNKCFLLRHLPMTMNHVQLPTFNRRSCLQIENLRG